MKHADFAISFGIDQVAIRNSGVTLTWGGRDSWGCYIQRSEDVTHAEYSTFYCALTMGAPVVDYRNTVAEVQ
jgi:hypothetical protein